MTTEEIRRNAADPYTMPASSLAYLGDAVYEIMVREHLVTHNVKTPSVASLEYVKATAQSAAMDKILPLLSERENDIYRRGRNSIHNTPPKSCTPSEYRKATGFEALFGYLWLMGETERIKELCAVGVGIGQQEEGTVPSPEREDV